MQVLSEEVQNQPEIHSEHIDPEYPDKHKHCSPEVLLVPTELQEEPLHKIFCTLDEQKRGKKYYQWYMSLFLLTKDNQRCIHHNSILSSHCLSHNCMHQKWNHKNNQNLLFLSDCICSLMSSSILYRCSSEHKKQILNELVEEV